MARAAISLTRVRRAALLVSLPLFALAPSGCLDDVGRPVTGGVGGAATSTGASAVGGAGGIGGVGPSTSSSGAAGGAPACAPGTTRHCYTGPAGTEGVGSCKGGVQACGPAGTFAGPCAGEVLPKPETCLTPVDDDCNGAINEGGAGCVCTPGEMAACYTGPAGTLGVGICVGGLKTCDAHGTSFGPCVGEITPQPETCFNAVDDDCNGEVNDSGSGCVCTPNEVVSCYTGPAGTQGVGACKAGTQTCSPQGTSFGPCVGEVTPLPETCNTPVDDDCNGQTNEGGVGCACAPGSTAACYSGPAATLGVGACKGGTKTCNAQGTAYGPCAGEVTPVPETCATPVDDDCNGQTNEGGAGCVCAPNAALPCYSGPTGTAGVGACKAGTRLCNAQGTALGACTGEVLPQVEDCFNNLDDNCDGQVNEGCACTPGQVVSCYTGPAGTLGVGPCAAGSRTCDAQGVYGPCTGQVLPQAETCLDLIDNDCNGQINEGGAGCVCLPSSTASCYTGPAGTVGVGICAAGTKTCNAQGTAYGACTGDVTPQVETCNTPVDDDCNGQTNEGGAGCACVPNAVSSCYTGPAGTAGVGVCKAGARTCNGQGTAYGPCVGQVLPGVETCNNAVDDDCNGQTNEGGAGCVCVPNAVSNCYSGPAGTSGVGVCAPGTATCNGLGTALGPCTGQVLPGAENCATAADDDCDGNTPACTGSYIWAKSFGSVMDDEGIVVATDPSSNVVLGGYMNGTVDFGCGSMMAGAADGALLVKLSSAGACLWGKRWGSVAAVNGVATDTAGNIYVHGYYSAATDFGGGMIPNAGGSDVFIVKLDPAGNHLWSKGFGDVAAQTAISLAVDPSGNVLVTGYFQGTINFGGGVLTSAGSTDIYLAKFTTAGAHVWSKRFGDSAGQLTKSVTTDTAGNVIITGSINGTTDFGGGTLTSAGLGDAFIAKFSSTGAHVFSKRFGDSADQLATGVKVDAAGNVVFTGYYASTIDLGGGLFTTTGGADIFLAKLSPTGAHIWSQTRGGPNSQSSLSLAMDAFGSVAITGVQVGSADLGGGLQPSAGGGDAFVAKYDASGTWLWSHVYGDSASQAGKYIAMDPAGNILLTGILQGPVDFGGGLLPIIGGEDILLAKLAP
jgi:uncharacterized protein (AIM24 family)